MDNPFGLPPAGDDTFMDCSITFKFDIEDEAVVMQCNLSDWTDIWNGVARRVLDTSAPPPQLAVQLPNVFAFCPRMCGVSATNERSIAELGCLWTEAILDHFPGRQKVLARYMGARHERDERRVQQTAFCRFHVLAEDKRIIFVFPCLVLNRDRARMVCVAFQHRLARAHHLARCVTLDAEQPWGEGVGCGSFPVPRCGVEYITTLHAQMRRRAETWELPSVRLRSDGLHVKPGCADSKTLLAECLAGLMPVQPAWHDDDGVAVPDWDWTMWEEKAAEDIDDEDWPREQRPRTPPSLVKYSMLPDMTASFMEWKQGGAVLSASGYDADNSLSAKALKRRVARLEGYKVTHGLTIRTIEKCIKLAGYPYLRVQSVYLKGAVHTVFVHGRGAFACKNPKRSGPGAHTEGFLFFEIRGENVQPICMQSVITVRDKANVDKGFRCDFTHDPIPITDPSVLAMLSPGSVVFESRGASTKRRVRALAAVGATKEDLSSMHKEIQTANKFGSTLFTHIVRD